MLNRVLRITCALTFLLLTGCAFSPEKIDVGYSPSSNATLIQGASDIGIKLQINDVRTTTDRVSSRTNAYGQELGAISLNEDVSTIVRTALETELRNRGYRVDGGKVSVVCDIQDFYNRFQTGFWSGTAVASVRFNVKVRDSQGNYIFSETVTGQGRKEKIQMATGKNAKPALDDALKNAVNALFQRDDFYQAIRRANSMP
jgi:uncharacterized lipoprotein YajG